MRFWWHFLHWSWLEDFFDKNSDDASSVYSINVSSLRTKRFCTLVAKQKLIARERNWRGYWKVEKRLPANIPGHLTQFGQHWGLSTCEDWPDILVCLQKEGNSWWKEGMNIIPVYTASLACKYRQMENAQSWPNSRIYSVCTVSAIFVATYLTLNLQLQWTL